MATTTSPLEFRKPVTTWNITAVFLALVLHGIMWFVVRLVFGDSEAVSAAQGQMILALMWMIGAIAIWWINLPPSRLHAVLMVLGCALFVTMLGSGVALIKFILLDGTRATQELLSSFLIWGGLMVLAQIVLAVPSAILLQMVALKRTVA
jgi:hypothetical protein